MCIVCAIDKQISENPDDEINRRIVKVMEDVANHTDPTNAQTVSALVMSAMMINILIYKELFRAKILTLETAELLRSELFESLDMAREETNLFVDELIKELPTKPVLKVV